MEEFLDENERIVGDGYGYELLEIFENEDFRYSLFRENGRYGSRDIEQKSIGRRNESGDRQTEGKIRETEEIKISQI